MVVSSVDDRIIEIVAKKICELRENNFGLTNNSEQMKIPRATSSLLSGYRIPKKIQSCSSSPSCIGMSVLDIFKRRPKLFTFKEACGILEHCDVNKDKGFIAKTIRKYAIIISGLPECAKEDIPLAAFFFIEEVFGIQPKIELCVEITEGYEMFTIGVVFDNIVTKQQIAGMIRLLDGSYMEIDTYFDINWIVEGLCAK